jgi:hypothetical protein
MISLTFFRPVVFRRAGTVVIHGNNIVSTLGTVIALPDGTVPNMTPEHSTMSAKTKANTADIKEAVVVCRLDARVSKSARLTLVEFLVITATGGMS